MNAFRVPSSGTLPSNSSSSSSSSSSSPPGKLIEVLSESNNGDPEFPEAEAEVEVETAKVSPCIRMTAQNSTPTELSPPPPPPPPPPQPQQSSSSSSGYQIPERTLMDEIIAAASQARRQEEEPPPPPPPPPLTSKEKEKTPPKPKERFGFKKGFLLSSTKAAKQGTSSTTQKRQNDLVEVVKPRSPTAPSNPPTLTQKITEEVQAALTPSFLGESQAKEDLLQRFLANPSAASALVHSPKLSHVLELLRSGKPEDARKAFALAHDDPSLQSQLTDIMKIVGSHFEGLAEAQKDTGRGKGTGSQPAKVDANDNDDEKVQKILEDSELRTYLVDPEVRNVLQECSDPRRLKFYLSESQDPKWKTIITKMMAAGLVQITQ